MTTFTNEQVFTVFNCCREGCGVAFAINADFERCRKSDRKSFYCPNGHGQWFPGESDSDLAQKLAGQLDIERSRLESARRERAAAERACDYQKRARKAVSTRLKKVKQRVGHGVCPCCNRSFKALADHMATKHPTYSSSVETHD